MNTYIDDVFGPAGLFAQKFPGYSPRDGQVRGSRLVDHIVRDGGIAMIDAPTGTGKSVMYLVPAIKMISERPGTKVVVVTSNIALQEQLIKTDLPRLRETLAWPFTFEIAKGFGNYYCRNSAEDADLERIAGHRLSSDYDQQLLEEVLAHEWVRGDVSEFPRELSSPVKRLVTIQSEDCLGKRCGHIDDCYPRAAKKRCGGADVIVTNYHLYAIDLAMRLVVDRVGVLPDHQILILDECFPAGTKVGEVPIETIEVGDYVPSYDEETGRFVRRRVTKKFSSVPRQMVKIMIGGSSIVCTAGHAFFTSRGWIAACDLKLSDVVLSSNDKMFHLREDVHAGCSGEGVVQEKRGEEGVLFEDLQFKVQIREFSKGVSGNDASSLLRDFGENEEEKPDVLRRDSVEGIRDAKKNWTFTTGERGEWNRYDGSTVDVTRSSENRMGLGIFSRNRTGYENLGVSLTLQDRSRSFGGKSGSRDRWEFSQITNQARFRSEKRRVSSWKRVESVQVLERGSDGKFGGNCPDGLVYNLEVSGTHTYLVEGLVVHNCHNMADLCRGYFGESLTIGGVKTLTHELDATGKRAEKLDLPKRIDRELKELIEKQASAYFEELDYVRRLPSYRSRLKEPETVGGIELEQSLRLAATEYQAAASSGICNEARDFLRNRAVSLVKKAELIKGARELSRDGWIYHVDADERGRRVELVSEPVSVADFLREALWGAQKNAVRPSPRSIVLTSATLATDSGEHGFDFAAEQLGIGDADELAVDSPFDFSRAVLVVPKDIPDPDPKKSREYGEAVADVVVSTAFQAKGRTMALFTSYRNLEISHQAAMRAGFDFPIYRQGEVPRTELVRRMKERPGLLLGTDSFWEGVDLPGEALVALVIDKLPFQHFEDPILDAVKDRDEQWFKRYYLPAAIIKWKQGFGRLIRSVSDYGVVVCCDNRLLSKPYGKQFRKALPRAVGFSSQVGDVSSILQSLKNGQELELGSAWDARAERRRVA